MKDDDRCAVSRRRDTRIALALCGWLGFVSPLSLRSEPVSATVYPEDIARIKTRGTLIVAQFKGSRPGFFVEDDSGLYPGKWAYTNDGHRLVGYDIDLAHRIAMELGVSVAVARAFPDFNAVCRSVASHEADIAISKLSVTYHRSQYVMFSRPYVTLRMGMLINRLQESQTRRGTDPVQACNDPSARIGVVDGTSFVDFSEELFPKAVRHKYPDKEALFKAVRAGDVLAAFYEEFEIRNAIRLYPDMPIFCREQYFPGREDQISMAVSPESTTLLSLVNLVLAREGLVTSVDSVLENYLPRGELSGSSEASAFRVGDPGFGVLAVLFLSLCAAWMWPAFRSRDKAVVRKGTGQGGGVAS